MSCRMAATKWQGRALCLSASDVDLLGDLDSAIHLDPKIPDRAFDLGMTE